MDEHLRDFKYERFIVNVMPPRDEIGIVWHYTDAPGALGIIESGTLRATSAAMLNDTVEFLHGLDLVDELWASWRSASPVDEVVEQWLVIARSKLENFHLTDSYIVCASRTGTSYSQFRKYGNYALGLGSFTPLEKIAATVLPPGVSPMRASFELGWRDVLYDPASKRDHVQKLLGELAELASIELRGHDDDIWLAALECVYRSVAYMKTEEFADEQEVRLCGQGLLTNARVGFKVGAYGIAPFIEIRTSSEFPNERLPLMSVKLGPSIEYPKTAETGLRILLRERGFDSYMPIDTITGTSR